MTSSARSMIDGGMASPSAVAVLRFTAISNLVGNCTGRSKLFRFRTGWELCRAGKPESFRRRPRSHPRFVDFVSKLPIMFCHSQQSDAMVRQVFGEVFAIGGLFPKAKTGSSSHLAFGPQNDFH